jgi:hypothetical protein
MKIEQTPHPLIEDHYHIQELIEGQEKRSNDRTYHQNRIKAIEERNELIRDNKDIVLTDFWCEECKKDFKSIAIKQIEDDWSSNQLIAFYKTKCFKGHWCIRFITDKQRDGFWQKSRFVALDRGNHFRDIIQPFETGFNMLYGKVRQ